LRGTAEIGSTLLKSSSKPSGMSTKEISLQKFIEKNKELLLPTPASNQGYGGSQRETPQSAIKILSKLVEVEKTNQTRL
jgi:hypothetical protein